MDLTFTGYRSIDAAPDDSLRLKWNAVRSRLDLPPEATPPSPTLAAVAALNEKINSLITWSQEANGKDVWQNPAETLFLGRGDCEDFAILKYAMLQKAGLPVRLVIGEIKSTMKDNPQHAWCAALIENSWIALDNKFDKIITPNNYLNFIPLASMHDDQVVRFGPVFSINEMLKAGA